MNALTRTLFLMTLAAALAAGQMTLGYPSSVQLPVNVPSSGTGGAPGGAGNPANLAVIGTGVPDPFIVGTVTLHLFLSHTRVADLTMTLSHCGTSVTLFSGSLNQAAGASGYYSFSDSAATTFASAVNQAAGAVPQGAYKPFQSLSPFNGQNAAGTWTLTIADLAAGVTGQAGSMIMEFTAGADFGSSFNPPLVIPDGAASGCVAPVTHVVNVPTPGKVGMLWAEVGLVHTYLSDLTVILTHAGVSATIMAAHTPTSPANLAGIYTFMDDAQFSWTQAVTGLATNVTVPAGQYRPLTPLSAFTGLEQSGPWYLTICDQAPLDTGNLFAMFLKIAPAAWNLQIAQPNGAASVTLTNSGGGAGHSFANLMTLAPGGYPNGWLYGLDIAFEDVVFELSLGGPFFGSLDSCGSALTIVPGPIPSGLTVYVMSLDIDPSGSVVTHKQAFSYTTP